MTALITLTTAGTDTGPFFNLYSNIDGFVTPFATNISKLSLVGGYTSTVVPNFTSTIQVRSIGACTNFVNLIISAITTTTTTTIVADKYLAINFNSGGSNMTVLINGIEVINASNLTEPLFITIPVYTGDLIRAIVSQTGCEDPSQEANVSITGGILDNSACTTGSVIVGDGPSDVYTVKSSDEFLTVTGNAFCANQCV